MYWIVSPDGKVSGGPSVLSLTGLADRTASTGKVLAYLLSFASVGLFWWIWQHVPGNQSFAGIATAIIRAFQNLSWLYGIILLASVSLVIIGGIRRIGAVTNCLCLRRRPVYVAAALDTRPVQKFQQLHTIIREALSPASSCWRFYRAYDRSQAMASTMRLASALHPLPILLPRRGACTGVGLSPSPTLHRHTVVVSNITALVIITTGAYREPEADGYARP